MAEQFQDLSIARELYRTKAQECWEILTHLYDWDNMPDSKLSFSINTTVVASFGFGGSELEFLKATFMSLNAYYRNKFKEADKALQIFTKLEKEKATDPTRPA